MSDRSFVEQSIAEKSRIFEEAYNGRDARRLVEEYFAPDEDAPTAYPPGGSRPVTGRAALIELFTVMIPGAPKIRLETLEVVTSGTVAYEVGRAFLTTAEGFEVFGRYTGCWIDSSQGWRVKADFFADDGWRD